MNGPLIHTCLALVTVDSPLAATARDTVAIAAIDGLLAPG
jgi:hypothetical protein